jgi:hypothetical protein
MVVRTAPPTPGKYISKIASGSGDPIAAPVAAARSIGVAPPNPSSVLAIEVMELE